MYNINKYFQKIPYDDALWIFICYINKKSVYKLGSTHGLKNGIRSYFPFDNCTLNKDCSEMFHRIFSFYRCCNKIGTCNIINILKSSNL